MKYHSRVRSRVAGKIVLIFLLLILSPWVAMGQDASSESKGKGENFRLKETQIKGKVKDLLGKMRLLESEIVGTVERPQLSYSLPWREPSVAGDLGAVFGGELEGDLLSDSYSFVDPDQLEREVLFSPLESR